MVSGDYEPGIWPVMVRTDTQREELLLYGGAHEYPRKLIRIMSYTVQSTRHVQ